MLLERLESCHTQLENCDPRCDEAEMTHGSDALATICTCTVPPSAGLRFAAWLACLLALLCLPSVLQAASFANLDLRPNTRDLQLSVLISHTHIVIQDTEPLLQKYRGYHRAQVFSCAALKRT